MCGVLGIFCREGVNGALPVNQALYDGLTVLQHRGQDAAGMITSNGQRVFLRKDVGLVRDVFHARHMRRLHGHMGLGHVRYPTAGSDLREEVQPFFVNSPFGIALGHNGNLTNAEQLRGELFRWNLRRLNTASDSEILLNIFAHELRKVVDASLPRVAPDDIFNAVRGVFKRCRGAYSVVVMVMGVGILAFRDPYGIRPLVYGIKGKKGGKKGGKGGKGGDGGGGGEVDSHMFASESVVMDMLGYELVGDVQPGEAVLIDLEGVVHRQGCASRARLSPCIFEYVYLARPDSIMDGIPVHQTHMNMGEKLARQIKREWGENDIDVVIAVPDTSRTTAVEMARVLKLPYREGFIKNRYIGRTFIMPSQAQRRMSVRQKLNPIGAEFRGKNVLLVDDSIVRGTTSRQIIQLARDAGARKVYFASAAPPVRYQNVYGIDMPSLGELVAHGRSVEEVGKEIGAERLFYQELGDLEAAVRMCNPKVQEFDASCFSGKYVTGDVSAEYLEKVDAVRGQEERGQEEEEEEGERDVLDLAEITDVR